MSAQGKPRGYGLVLCLFFLVLGNKNQERFLMLSFSKHWIMLVCPVSLNLFQGQGLLSGQ